MAKVLIVEHDDTIAAWLSTEMKKAGHKITHVADSLSAWRALGQNDFDVIAMDIMVPGIESFVLAQRALQENPATQVIFITGFMGVAMDTYGTPAYAPAPVTLPPFHLKHINSRVHYLMYGGAHEDLHAPRPANSAVIHADFGARKA